ncbi:MAG: M28 family metallopeptidase [Blastocatellia bacterium]
MIKRFTQITLLGLFLAVAVSAQTAKSAVDSSAYSSHIAKITAGATNAERGKAIQDALKAIGVDYKTEDFTSASRSGKEIKGSNIIATIPNTKSKRTIMIGAHYDRVAVGSGAIDNASGSAAVLELLRAFKANPVKNVAVVAGFWDQEEVGLVGSREFVKSREKGGLPNIYINFDVYGAGDTIWLWTADENAEFAKGFSKAAKDAKFGFLVSREYPPSDHRSFAVPGVESFSFSLGPANEAANIIKVLKGEQIDQANFPKVLQTIHTPNDTTDKIDANAVIRSLKVVEAAIRTLDK